jgi:SAM-dependent methyltransferase
VAFSGSADSYDRFMGRYSSQLAAQLADLGRVQSGQHVLDVGCGPGALTAELVARGAVVAAVDPSPSFVAAARERFPEADIREAGAEDIPFGGDEFDAALAQLVVQFMSDPVAGLGEMARVTRSDGAVVACVWDAAGGETPLGPFWRAVHRLDPDAEDETGRAGTGPGQLAELFRAAGLRDVEDTGVTARVQHDTFEDWWEPFRLGVGPAGVYLVSHPEREEDIRELCRTELGDKFKLDAKAWAARGTV